jgi:hypothetical protein
MIDVWLSKTRQVRHKFGDSVFFATGDASCCTGKNYPEMLAATGPTSVPRGDLVA